MLTREQILSANDLTAEDVDVPEWGGSVRITVMSGAARDAFQGQMSASDKSISYFHNSLLVATAVGEDGAPLFTVADMEALRTKSAAVVTRVANVAERLNGFGAKAVETAEKNSEAAPSGSSGSDSPAS
ncbi:hypothetical protein [Paraburkholderia sp. BCC1884]|uniref:hypothetical protein n=1 Tax=Paraburkholderia sp. BCC1884 TaxID=2562668 RepID=UPI00118420D6|nr:hypothetical protein [Paraburkholderia sp. BCC1884]